MTTATITESDLIADAEFLKWCAAWEAEKRCPFAMADWIIEKYDDERLYLAARWAYAKEERLEECDTKSRFCPYKNGENSYFYCDIETGDYVSSHAPVGGNGGPYFKSFQAAIAHYFVHFNAELAAKYPPKDEVWT